MDEPAAFLGVLIAFDIEINSQSEIKQVEDNNDKHCFHARKFSSKYYVPQRFENVTDREEPRDLCEPQWQGIQRIKDAADRIEECDQRPRNILKSRAETKDKRGSNIAEPPAE